MTLRRALAPLRFATRRGAGGATPPARRTGAVTPLPHQHTASASQPTRSRESGFVLVWMALMITALLGMAGLAIDVANWYFQAQRQQKAADAAALAAPSSCRRTSPSRTARPNALAERNGYQTGVPARP